MADVDCNIVATTHLYACADHIITSWIYKSTPSSCSMTDIMFESTGMQVLRDCVSRGGAGISGAWHAQALNVLTVLPTHDLILHHKAKHKACNPP